MRKRSEVAAPASYDEAAALVEAVAEIGEVVGELLPKKAGRAKGPRPLREATDTPEVREAFGVPDDLVYNPNAAVEKELDPGFQRVVERVLIHDGIDEVYARLEKALRVVERLESAGNYVRALEEAAPNAWLSKRLHVTAKVERQRWEFDNEVLFGAMRAEATRELQREKDEGKRSKQITDADVAMKCAALYQDEYRAQEMRRARAKAMEEALAHMVEVWMVHVRTLQILVGRAR